MPKAVTLGNGKLLVGFDERAQVRDLYFPYVGLENHVSGLLHRVGVYAEGEVRWLDHPSWRVTIDCNKETAASEVTALNEELGVRLGLNDLVYNELNIFLRAGVVENLREKKRAIKVFFAQQFRISESRRGDTGYFDPRCGALIHYKGRRAFLINIKKQGEPEPGLDEYSVGLFDIEGRAGTHADAEDGALSGNPIEHGSVDSVAGAVFELSGKKAGAFHYWVTAGESIAEARSLNDYVLEKGPEHLMKTTKDYWHAWVNRQNFSFYGLSREVIALFKKSLIIIRSHADNDGAIIASGDSDMLQHGRDTYSYMWPRDGALTALALNRAGDFNVARRFFEFCRDAVSEEGYFMHKYRADGSLGSSWHPWVRNGRPELPIQEDETALVLYALWHHYTLSKNLEFIEALYNPLVGRSADFLAGYTYEDTGLSYPSYDLWEEKYGITTFTASAKFGALEAAAYFAGLLGKVESEARYRAAAERIREGILDILWSEDIGMFCKLMDPTAPEGERLDPTIDMSSFYGVFKFGVLPVDDSRMRRSLQTIKEKLLLQSEVGGVPRYEGDRYYRTSPEAPPNPWFITTMWLAQYYIKAAHSEDDLDRAREWLAWAERHALPSGILSEQLHPDTGRQLNVAPLTWSHAEFVITVIDYLAKLEELGICESCYPIDDR